MKIFLSVCLSGSVLTLFRYKEGLVALNRILSLQDTPDSLLPALFGEDVGVAYLTLGKLKRHLKHITEAVKCFQMALKHNPFLWSAYQMLCDMGEEVCPEKYFVMPEYPKFLKSHPLAPPSFLHTSQSVTNPYGKPSADSAKNKGKAPLVKGPGIYAESAISNSNVSAFKPVAKDKPLLMTPDIFHDSSLGNALASSTPTFPRHHPMRDNLSLTVGSFGSYGLPHGARGGEDVRAALHFGSTGTCHQQMTPNMTPRYRLCWTTIIERFHCVSK